MQRKKGFTLIELILVLSLITIIISIAAINYKTYKEEADRRNIIDKGIEIYNSVMWLYREDNADISSNGIKNRINLTTGILIDEVVFPSDGSSVLKLKFSYNNKYYFLELNTLNWSFDIMKLEEFKIIYSS